MANLAEDPAPPLEATPGFAVARSQKRALLAQQQASWEAGAPVRPEELLARWPTDPAADPDVVSLLFEDFLRRRARGEDPSVDDYGPRFPEHKSSLADLISNQVLLRSFGRASGGSGATLRLPDVGDELFGFRLRAELGRGAFARVFLAEQADLAGRPVVLKVSAVEGSEPQTLAQLQHTHIVPIYSVHEDARAGLRAVCMPYFGGASLSGILETLRAGGNPPLQGAQLVTALEAIQGPASNTSGPAADSQTPLRLLGGLGYVRAAAWVVARLAEGLQHAHERGVLHRDIKPSNVLVSADGQPLLLDFNLAQDQKGDDAQATLGGTVAYMAPEHLRALVGRSAAQAPRLVDHRSDLYSLGLVLYEMLTGQRPFEQSASYSFLPVQIEAMAVERSRAAPSPRAQRPDVPWSLESIARKCLAPDPVQRYQQAGHLAEDLRRFLEDRPLKYAPELSRAERLRKWLRRNPRLTSAGSVAAVAVLVLCAAGIALSAVGGQLGAARARERQQAYEAGTVRALCLVNTTLDGQENLRQGAAVCEQTLALYGILDGNAWQEHPDWRRLDPNERRRLAEDTHELLLALASAQVRLAPGDPLALRQALTLLDRAEAIGGLPPSKALWLDRAQYLDQLAEPDRAQAARQTAAAIPAASARDHYLLATTYARQGGREGYTWAVAELNEALRLNPVHYWSWFQRGICHLELGEYVLAAGDFGICIGLWPDFAWGYFNRGYAFDQSGQKAEAVRDYSQALARDPGFVPALVNRALACLDLKRHSQALADFNQALAGGKDEASVHAGRGMALEALGRHPEADAAFQAALARAEGLPEPGRTRLRCSYAFAVAARAPASARQAFEDVLRQDPHHAQALYGLAMLAMTQEQPAAALSYFDRAIAAAPTFLEAWRYRAILLARVGRLERACQDINWCLEREPRSGATLYAAACVMARAAEQTTDPLAASQALDLLQRAFAVGVGPDKAAADPDLAGFRTDPRFQELLRKVAPAKKE
jgi:serine/threonine protein kinase/tetratricopeptide (TPR) repeat protein